MKRMMRPFLAAALAAAALFLTFPAGAATPGVGECMDCHGDKTIEMSLPNGQTVSLYVDLQAYRSSVHGGGSCVTCHADAKAPHEKLAKVDCGRCHSDAAKSYEGESPLGGFCTKLPGGGAGSGGTAVTLRGVVSRNTSQTDATNLAIGMRTISLPSPRPVAVEPQPDSPRESACRCNTIRGELQPPGSVRRTQPSASTRLPRATMYALTSLSRHAAASRVHCSGFIQAPWMLPEVAGRMTSRGPQDINKEAIVVIVSSSQESHYAQDHKPEYLRPPHGSSPCPLERGWGNGRRQNLEFRGPRRKHTAFDIAKATRGQSSKSRFL